MLDMLVGQLRFISNQFLLNSCSDIDTWPVFNFSVMKKIP